MARSQKETSRSTVCAFHRDWGRVETLPLTEPDPFNSAANRAAFLADEEAYCDKYGLTAEQRDAVRSRNVLAMIEAASRAMRRSPGTSSNRWLPRNSM
jgi:Aromatic-ring-opening dioxygenase LigAB, LigA subunit